MPKVIPKKLPIYIKTTCMQKKHTHTLTLCHINLCLTIYTEIMAGILTFLCQKNCFDKSKRKLNNQLLPI